MTLLQLTGIVKSHTKRGKKLGFPTANINTPVSIEDGIYIAYTLVGKRRLPSLVFIGIAETFGDKERRIESYILDFNEDLYGQEITLELIKKLRNNKKFDSEKELIEQMKKDEEDAREFFQIGL